MSSLLSRLIMTGLIFSVSWLLWSGMYKPLLLSLGALSVAITMILAYRMRFFKVRVYALRFSLGIMQYWGWLFVEVIKSSLVVAGEVLKPTISVKPKLVRIPRASRSDFQTMMLGNSITLTPGTITLDVDDDVILVHALTKDGADDLLAGTMAKRVDAFSEDA
jgi:multicomponent Na+:H+ antiporter subunit E